MELRRLSDHAWAYEQPDRGTGWSNSGLVDAGEGLVVDSLYDLPLTRRMLERYAERDEALMGLPPQRVGEGDTPPPEAGGG